MDPHNEAAASRRRTDRVTRGLYVVVVTALIVVVVCALLAVKQVRDLSGCVTLYNQQFSLAYQARLAASVEASEKLDDVIAAVDKHDPARFRSAVSSYVEAREKQRAEAIKSPYPALPSSFCGEVRH